MEEKEALARLIRKEEPALVWVIERYSGYVSTIVYNIIGSKMTVSDVEEVTSDVFLTLWTNADRVAPGKLKAYLSGIARNKAAEKTRQWKDVMPLEENMLELPGMDPEETLVSRERAALVQRAVQEMPEPEREIFLRHYYYFQSVTQIAGEMNLNSSTVKTKLRRGRETLKRTIQKGGYDLGKEDF